MVGGAQRCCVGDRVSLVSSRAAAGSGAASGRLILVNDPAVEEFRGAGDAGVRAALGRIGEVRLIGGSRVIAGPHRNISVDKVAEGG